MTTIESNTIIDSSKMRKLEDYFSKNKYTSSIYQFWKKSLPDDLRLSKSLRNVRLPIGVFVQLCGLGMFLTFLLIGINTAKNASFLSLDKTAGDCDDVKITISATYYVDYNGYWSTTTDFDDSKEVFRIDFLNVQINQDEYTHFTKEVLYPYLRNLNMANKPWSENFLIWTKSANNFQFEYGGGEILVHLGGVEFSYENDYYWQNCETASGSCAYGIGNSLESKAIGSLMKSYLINEVNPFVEPNPNDDVCNIPPSDPNSNMSTGPIGYGVNMYSLPNSGGNDDLVGNPYYLSSSNTQLSTPWLFSYLNDATNGSISISSDCNTDDYVPSNAVESSQYLYFPIIGTGLFEIGINSNGQQYNILSANSNDCNVCSETMNPDCLDPTKLSVYVGMLKISYNQNKQCQNYDSTTGLYSDCAFENFYTQNTLDQRSNLNTILFPLIDILNNDYDITTLINEPSLQEYFNFNAITNVYITQLQASNLEVYNRLNDAGGLTASNVQLSCSDSLGELGPFKPSSYASNNAPTQLTENYYVCVPTESTVFLDSFGIAVANTGTFMGIFLTIVITCYVTFIKYTSKTEISTVSSDDIEGMLEILGTALVERSILREKKQKLSPGVITNISNELVIEEKSIEDGNNSIELSTTVINKIINNSVSPNFVKQADL